VGGVVRDRYIIVVELRERERERERERKRERERDSYTVSLVMTRYMVDTHTYMLKAKNSG
jgi:hypothetical protein